MKKFNFLVILSLVPVLLFSQNWREAFYSNSNDTKSTMNFYEIQKDFNEYWKDYDIKGGYYIVDGQKKKAVGWKQFKRWEWFWETRIDSKTGKFPTVDKFSVYKELKAKKTKTDNSNWQSMGPNSSYGGYAGIGRINCIAFHPTDKSTFWIGAPSGGLWKTTDGGLNWTVLTDNLPVIGVSEIFIPNDYETSKTIFIATGDRDAGDNYSIGVLKSTDDGQTWSTTGLTFNVASRYRITRMLVHPTQQNIMYVATNGGIYKTINGGTDWSMVKSGTFFDMEFKSGGEDTVLYAATADYNGSPLLYKTKDAGVNWNVKYSFPTAAYRVELAVAKSNSSVVYALSSKTNGGMDGIYKSTDGGESFAKVYDGTVSGKNLLNWHANSTDATGQGWYDLTLSVSPINENEVYLGGINSWKSTNGGTSWFIINHWYGKDGIPAVHADKHYMIFQDGTTFFEANDGGLYKTTNGGSTWTDLTDGMVISQMYKLSASQTVKDKVITGLQDNGSKLVESGAWEDVKGGDGMECLIDYLDANIQYATYAEGQIDRTLNNWQSSVDISANIPGGPSGAWVTPYVIDPKDNKVLYVGYADVWKTTDRGDSWTKISAVNISDNIRSMAIASSNNQVLYIASLNQLYKTIDGGKNWVNLTQKLPSTGTITSITIDDMDYNKIWITFGEYNSDRIFESNNAGDNWTNISSGLPLIPVSTIVKNKLSKTQQLYAGTDVGVFIKEGNADWTLFSNNLPSVVVSELEIHYDNANPSNSVLYAATYGRGLWKSNLAPFEMPEIVINLIEGTYYVSNTNKASVQVSFNTAETFTSNTFSAYLSDATGGFSNPVLIGTLVSDTEKSISAQIPEGTVSSDLYRIKVLSSSPILESTVSNSFKVVLDNNKPTVNVTSTITVPTTNSQNIEVRFKFNEAVTGFEQSDINVTNASITSFVVTSTSEYKIFIKPTASGSVTVNVPADIATDLVGNTNVASNVWSINYYPTGIDDISSYGIGIYPNPSNGMINIKFDKSYSLVKVIVMDVLGKVVHKEQVVGEGVKGIDLSHLAKNIYLVKLNLEGKEVISKIVIEK